MYEIQLGLQGQHRRMIKNKSDFRDLMDIVELAHGSCPVCRTESNIHHEWRKKIAAYGYVCEELNGYLESTVDTLRSFTPDALRQCATHCGVVRTLMGFLKVQDTIVFTPKKGDLDLDAAALMPKCSLSRSFSDQFAAIDSTR